jgi:hypothetical protein
MHPLKHFQRHAIISLGSKIAKKCRNNFHIVVNHMGIAFDDASQGIPIAPKIRNKDFYLASRHHPIQSFHASGKYLRPSIGQIIPCDRCYNNILKSQFFNSLGKPIRFTFIHSVGFPMLDIAIEAVAGADITENQKSGRPGIKTFGYVGTVRLLADGVEM